MRSQPDAVTELIVAAVKATAGRQPSGADA
jgi:hypothetical protein